MKTAVKKLTGAKAQVHIEVSSEVVKNKFEEVFSRIAKEAKVKGFRPGHVPRDVLEKNFSSDAHHVVLKELIPDIYSQAVKKEGLEVLDAPEISEVKLNRDSLSFIAEVETAPEIPIKNYKRLPLNFKAVSVEADEVKRHIDSLKESRKLDAADDNLAKGMGYPSLAELEKSIERQIVVQKDNAQRHQIEHQLIDSLTKDMNFALPQSLVDKQSQELLRQAKVELALRGMPKDAIAEQEKKISQEVETEARSQVKVYLVLRDIARKENIPLDDSMSQKVMEFLLREAQWQLQV